MSTLVLGIHELTEFRFSSAARLKLHDGPLNLGWRHSGRTSDFIADTMAMPFLASTTAHKEIHHAIGYMSNELIENAVKFRRPGTIVIEACILADVFMMRVGNEIDIETSRRFRTILLQMLSLDPGELLIRQIEANAASNDSGSGLGLLTLLSDYGAKMGWVFETSTEDSVTLTTTASLSLPLPLASTG